MANYDRLKKCKCNGCPLSVDVVTSRDGNGVCHFHHAAKASEWMVVRDRVLEHREFLLLVQQMGRLIPRYKHHHNESVDAWMTRIKPGLKQYILKVELSPSAEHSMQDMRDLLAANSG